MNSPDDVVMKSDRSPYARYVNTQGVAGG